MQRAFFLTAALAALSLAACNRAGNTAGNAATTAAGAAGNAAATAGNAAATAGNAASTTLNAAENKVGAAVGATSAATLGSHDTGAFVDNLVQANMYEIDAGKIAEQKATSPDVKAFGRMMVTDHTKLTNASKPAVEASGVKVPTALDNRRNGLIDNLNAAPADQFDKTYVDQQVAGHQETLTLLQGYTQNGSNAALKTDAQKAIPTVQHHLDRAKALQTKLGTK